MFSGKLYENDQIDNERMNIFAKNLKKIEMHNYLHQKGVKSYTLGINEYADMVGVIHLYLFYLWYLLNDSL